MICPKCREAGTTSRVYVGESSKTLMGWRPYYDEQGTYHSHDGNRVSVMYRCSKNHAWIESSKEQCPNCDFGSDPPSIRYLE